MTRIEIFMSNLKVLPYPGNEGLIEKGGVVTTLDSKNLFELNPTKK